MISCGECYDKYLERGRRAPVSKWLCVAILGVTIVRIDGDDGGCGAKAS